MDNELNQEMDNMSQKLDSTNQSVEELARMAREERRFTVLKRERAISDEEVRRNNSLIILGGCFLAAMAISMNKGTLANESLAQSINELGDIILSWDKLKEFFANEGPGYAYSVILGGISGAKAVLSQIKLNKLRVERDDFDSCLEGYQLSTVANEDTEGHRYVRRR